MVPRSTPVAHEDSARRGLFSVVLMLDGWLVWDGLYTPLRVGEEFSASVEFAPLSDPTATLDGTRLDHLAGNRYSVVAEIRGHSDDVVALSVDDFTMLRRRHPDDAFSDMPAGSRVSLELGLNLNPWAEEPWARNAAVEYSADLTWCVEQISLVGSDQRKPIQIDEANIDTVESSDQHCLVTCTRSPH